MLLGWRDMKLNNKQEQIMLYLYEFKNTPERGVGPDPRLTIRGITDGTQIIFAEVQEQLQKLISKAFVRPVLVGEKTFHYLTVKGYNQVEKIQKRSFKIGLNSDGIGVSFGKSETSGSKATGERSA